MIQLVMAYRHRGWRWPLQDGDAAEVWTPAHELVVVIPAALLRATVDHLVQGQRLQDAFAELPGPEDERSHVHQHALRLQVSQALTGARKPGARGPPPPRRPLAMARATRRLKGYG